MLYTLPIIILITVLRILHTIYNISYVSSNNSTIINSKRIGVRNYSTSNRRPGHTQIEKLKDQPNNQDIVAVNETYPRRYPLELKSKPLEIFTNALTERLQITSKFTQSFGVYLWHNYATGEQYVGSGINPKTGLSGRLSNYYQSSRLAQGRLIDNSILSHGHNQFALVILALYPLTSGVSKGELLNVEQHYINLYKPALNSNISAHSSLGFKHSEETKDRISKLRTGVGHSDETKSRLSLLNSGVNNPFYNKTHTTESLSKMSESKVGSKNPMYGKEKSVEFLYQQSSESKKGAKNPMYGKGKNIYVYKVLDNGDLDFVSVQGTKATYTNFPISQSALTKRIASGESHNGYRYSYVPLH